MKNKMFIFVVIAILLLLFLVGTMMYKNLQKKDMLGDFVFSKIILEINNLDTIKISNNDNNYDFFLKDGLWRMKQADGYYINQKIFNALLDDVYNSKYYSFMNKENEDIFSSYTEIDFYKNTDKKIDSITIGSKNQNAYNFAKKDGKISLISGVFNLPKQKLSWIAQPSFDLENIIDPKLSELNSTLKSYFSYMYFEDVISIDNFDYEINNEKVFSIETENGLIVEMNVFKVETGYWSKISIKTNNMPKTHIKEYVDENAFLYDGWYFKLPDDVGVQFFKDLYNGF